jgi:autophagy-related protein 9
MTKTGGPWAPFENNWHLKEDYKKVGKRKELADELSRCILWVGVANFLFCPVILLWQILYLFFSYAELIKREPGSLGSRCWSLYGKMYLRHFNELDHEMYARLNRAYRPAAKYMDSFTSPLLTIIAESVAKNVVDKHEI